MALRQWLTYRVCRRAAFTALAWRHGGAYTDTLRAFERAGQQDDDADAFARTANNTLLLVPGGRTAWCRV